MNLKKLFLYELASGIVLSIVTHLWISELPFESFLKTINVIAVLIIIIYNQAVYGKKNMEIEENALVLRKTGIGLGVFLGVPSIIVLMNSKNFTAEQSKYVSQFLGYYWLPAFFLSRSLIGLTVQKYYSYRKMKENAE